MATPLTPNAIRLLGPEPAISPDEFLRIWTIYEYGHQEDTYIQVAYAIAKERKFDGAPLTLDFLIERFRLYVETAKKNYPYPRQPMSLLKWMQNRRYNEDLTPPQNPRLDRYA